MLSKYVTMVKGAVADFSSETVNDYCTLIWICVSCPSHFPTCKIRQTCEIVNTLTVCIHITALWDLTSFSLAVYIYMYVAEKLVAFKFRKKTKQVAGYCETIAPVNKCLRRHTPGVCDVFGYHREMIRLLAIIKPHVPKIN